MIPANQRLFCPIGVRTFSPPVLITWHFIDFDTRRWLMFEGPDDPLGKNDGQQAMEALLSVIDKLDDDVTKITFTADAKHWMATKSPDDDVTPIVSYPRFTEAEVGSLAAVTLQKGAWEEVDRLGPDLDLIRPRRVGARSDAQEGLYVFKYYTVPTNTAENRAWTSTFYHRALSIQCQNIVPFGDFVVDESTKRLVGYTTTYISGGSLDTRRIPVFKQIWVKQLISLIDLLNLRYGLLHQDVAPKNMVLDDEKDQILLFDFEYATLHGSSSVMKIADDVVDLCFSIYQLVTGDRKTGHQRSTRKLRAIMTLQYWPLRKNMKLDHGVSTDMIKADLEAWVRRRRATAQSTFDLQASLYVPEMVVDQIMEISKDGRSGSLPAHLVSQADPSTQIVRWKRPAAAHLHPRRY